MDRLRKNKRAFLLSSKVRKLRTPKKNKIQEPSSRTRTILALIPPDDSEGPSSSSDEEDAGNLSDGNADTECFTIGVLDNNIGTTLEDVLKEVPTSIGYFEDDVEKITLPTDIFDNINLNFDTFENLSPVQTPIEQDLYIFPGPSTSGGKDRSLDHNYSINVQTIGSNKAVLTNISEPIVDSDIAQFEVPDVELKTTQLEKNCQKNPMVALQTPKPGHVVVKPKKIQTSFLWEKNVPFRGAVTETTWLNENLTPNNEVLSPFEYFSKVFTNDVWELMILQTNLYSCQKSGTPINVNLSEMKGFVGILLLMGIVDMPSYTDYWSGDLRYEKVASVMSLKRFQSIRRFLHFTNNDLSVNDPDRYNKIRPLVDKVRRNFLTIPEEGKYSIDEMVVPYKGKRAGNRRQYLKNKPKKWGFKVFVRAGVSGMIYDFLLYGGDEDTFRNYTFSNAEEHLGSGGKVVVSLCKSIQQPICSFVFFDNFFCSLELLILLREKYGIFSLGTLRADRLRKCPLISDKILAKKGRGSFDMAVDNNHNVCAVKWEDNRSVCLASTYCEVQPVGKIKRFPKRKKNSSRGPCSKIDVTCPNIIKQYNCFMGGVDLADMLIALYRTAFRTHRWYMAIFSQILDMCISNAWILYRRDFKECGTKKQMALKTFRRRIAEELLRTAKRYAPSPKGSLKQVGIKKPRRAPEDVMRYDKLEHFPEMMDKGRCGFCKTGQTRVQCMKCNVRLCLTQEKNCFYLFHKKP